MNTLWSYKPPVKSIDWELGVNNQPNRFRVVVLLADNVVNPDPNRDRTQKVCGSGSTQDKLKANYVLYIKTHHSETQPTKKVLLLFPLRLEQDFFSLQS